MKYLSSKEYAEKLGVSTSRVIKLLNKRRIKRVFKVNQVWVIPENGF